MNKIYFSSVNILKKEDVRIINPERFIPITNAKPVTSANEDSLVFIVETAKDKENLIRNTKARTIICDYVPSDVLIYKDKCLIISSKPKLFFAKIVNASLQNNYQWGIHPSAVIHPEAKIAKKVYIGPHVSIGKSEIGENTIIHSNVSIYDNVKIGKNVIIDSGAVIGSAGFGFVREEDGTPYTFPQIGGVIIGDNVEIGANTCIDRGALQDTIIGNFSKIDNLTEIGHNVQIGEKLIITAGVLIGGSSIIGDEGWIAPNVSIKQKSTIGKRVFIGMGSVVIRNIKEDNMVFGNPAKIQHFPKS